MSFEKDPSEDYFHASVQCQLNYLFLVTDFIQFIIQCFQIYDIPWITGY